MPSSTATSRSAGSDDAVAAMFAAIDILIDCATRVPALRELAEHYVGGACRRRRRPRRQQGAAGTGLAAAHSSTRWRTTCSTARPEHLDRS